MCIADENVSLSDHAFHLLSTEQELSWKLFDGIFSIVHFSQVHFTKCTLTKFLGYFEILNWHLSLLLLALLIQSLLFSFGAWHWTLVNDLNRSSFVLHWSQLAQSSRLISPCAIYNCNIGLVICCWNIQHRGRAFFSLAGLLHVISVMAIKHIVWMVIGRWCVRWSAQPVISSLFNVILILGISRAIVWLWQEAFLLVVIWIIRQGSEGGCWLLDVEFFLESVVRYLRIIRDVILRQRWACWVVLVLTAQQAVNVVFFDVLREILLLWVRVADFPLDDFEWHRIDAPLLLETIKAVIFLHATAEVS